MGSILSGKKICILVASGFAEEQFSAIQKTLGPSGASVKVIAPENGLTHGWHDNGWGHYFPVDVLLAEAMGSDFDRIILAGGSRGVDKLKGNLHTRRILRHFFEAKKPIIAVGEAVELLALCDQVRNCEVSAPAMQADVLKAAGAVVSTQNETTDGLLLTFASLGDNWLELMLQHLAAEPQAQQQAAA